MSSQSTVEDAGLMMARNVKSLVGEVDFSFHIISSSDEAPETKASPRRKTD